MGASSLKCAIFSIDVSFKNSNLSNFLDVVGWVVGLDVVGWVVSLDVVGWVVGLDVVGYGTDHGKHGDLRAYQGN